MTESQFIEYKRIISEKLPNYDVESLILAKNGPECHLDYEYRGCKGGQDCKVTQEEAPLTDMGGVWGSGWTCNEELLYSLKDSWSRVI